MDGVVESEASRDGGVFRRAERRTPAGRRLYPNRCRNTVARQHLSRSVDRQLHPPCTVDTRSLAARFESTPDQVAVRVSDVAPGSRPCSLDSSKSHKEI